ncbi:MAG: hypothetical protein HUU20_09885 [Pirellulales bacterium]|nr:hypothetical protein [Pirellulales bacterium]
MTPLLGLIVVGLAGALNGAFALPMKKARLWAWENTWLVYSFVGMVVVGWGVALWSVPRLPAVYASVGVGVIALVFIFGMLWGVANVLFGQGIHLLGIGLAFPITIGLSVAIGSLATLAAKDPAALASGGGIVTVLGVAAIIAGVSVCAVAGVQRDRQSTPATSGAAPGLPPGKGPEYRLVLALAVVIAAGLLDPTLNFAFHFGAPIEAAATAQGASPLAAADALWVWPLLGSFLVNAVYCSVLLTRNGTWSRFREPGSISHWGLALGMGMIWMASISLYGRGAAMMGEFGKSVGWAVFYCAIILSSGIWGILCGEWRGAKARPLRTMFVGLALLLAAMIILGYGNHLFELKSRFSQPVGLG